MAELKDSGARRDFGTGAVRDVAEGKGRCDLLPLYQVATILNDEIIKCIADYEKNGSTISLQDAIYLFSDMVFGSQYTAMLETILKAVMLIGMAATLVGAVYNAFNGYPGWPVYVHVGGFVLLAILFALYKKIQQ